MHIFHYFELTMMLDSEKFHTQLNRAYEKSNGELYADSENDNKYVDYALLSKGIKITYHDNTHKKKVKLTINPDRLLADDKALQKLEKHVDNYFSSEYSLDDFRLTRMGLIADIDVRERWKVAAYLKVLQRVGRVKGFSPSSNSWIDKGVGFWWKGNSNAIEFMIYDLEKMTKDQLTEADSNRKKLKHLEKTEGILRAEVWLSASKAIRYSTNETVATEQMADLLKNSQKIFFETFEHIIPFGAFYKKSEAVEIIRREVSDRTLKWKMLRLLALIPEKKSLLLAQKALNYRRVDEVMGAFAEIDLSPVTLSKRHDVKQLKNLYRYFID